MPYEQLKLSNQLCFPVYTASRLITREYQPYLSRLNLTYPQYLVMMVLWENDSIPVSEITTKLLLNTNTITPLLKRMEMNGIIHRSRSQSDERQVLIKLTEKGKALEEKSAQIPLELLKNLENENISMPKLVDLRDVLNELIQYLQAKNETLMLEGD